MAFLKRVLWPTLMVFSIVISCSDKNPSNPLSAKNSPPTLEIIGFAADTLTFAENSKYRFEFKASDPDNNPLTVTVQSRDRSGAIEIVGNSNNIYRADYTPFRKGEHIIEISVSDKIEQVSDNLSVVFFENASPIAVLTYREVNRNVADKIFTYEFDASESSDQDGTVKKAKWDLNGTTREDLATNKIVHNFDDYGLYKIKLYVFDEHDAWDSTSTLINNSLPQLTIRADKTSGNFPLTVNFSAEASNYDHSPISFEWDFGDGSKSNLQNPDHTFNQEGEYVVKCTASDHIGSVEDSITINSSDQPPVAKFNINPETNIKNGDQVIFNASESYDNSGIKQYYWSLKMPDGQTNPLTVTEGEIYNYTVNTIVGTNSVGLMVEDFTSNFSDIFWVELIVENQSPQSKFVAQATSFKIRIVENNSSDPDPYDALSFRWFINDGEITTASNQLLPEFTFSNEGNYGVTLRVTDSNGAFDELQTTVFVPGKPTAQLTSVDNTTNREALTLDGSQSTGSGNLRITKYYFYLLDNGQTLLNANSVNDATFVYQNKMPVGTHRFGLVVEDENSVKSDLVAKDIQYLNSSPDVEFTYAIEPEKLIVTTNSSNDVDPGDAITFSWYIDQQHIPEKENESTPSFTVNGGSHEVMLRVTDNHAGYSDKRNQVEVPGRPIASFVFPDNQASFETFNKSSVVLDASTSEAGYGGGGVAAFIWQVKFPDSTVVPLGETANPLKTITTDYPVGVDQIGLKVRNQAGYESDLTWQNLTIKNTAPVAEFTYRIFDVDKVVIDSNTSIDIDPGDTLSYQWYVNYQHWPEFDNEKTPTFQLYPGYQYTLKLRVTDDHGAYDEKSYQFWIYDR